MPNEPYKIEDNVPMSVGEPDAAYQSANARTLSSGDNWNPNIPFHGTQEEWWEHFHRIEAGHFTPLKEANKEFEAWKKEISRKQVEVSDVFKANRTHVYDYTLETFGCFQAEHYLQIIEKSLNTLYKFYTAYPECRHLATKSRMYRNIILDAHPIVYRITDGRVEVPDILHSASSTGKIRAARNIRL